jgi:hypothetical protein
MTPIHESRERKRLYAPPRSALRTAGQGSAFGPGFWSRLSKSGAAPLLVFMAAGAGIVLFGLAGTVGPWKEGLQANGDPRFFLVCMAFGSVFLLISLRMMQLHVTQAKGAESRKQVDPSQPWTGDHPWRPEGMGPDYAEEGAGSALGRIAFFGLIGLFNLVFTSPSPWLLRGIVILFDLFALLILWDSLHKIWQSLRHPRPTMRWTTFPVFLGSRLEGVLFSRPALRASGPVKATLRCIQDSGSSPSSEAFVIYEQAREIPSGGDRLAELPIAFDIPTDLPGTDFARDAPTYWQVLLIVPVIGPDFETVFLAPVYEPADAPPSWRAEG